MATTNILGRCTSCQGLFLATSGAKELLRWRRQRVNHNFRLELMVGDILWAFGPLQIGIYALHWLFLPVSL